MKLHLLLTLHVALCSAEFLNTSSENESSNVEARKGKRIISRIFKFPRHNTGIVHRGSKLTDNILNNKLALNTHVDTDKSSAEYKNGDDINVDKILQSYKDASSPGAVNIKYSSRTGDSNESNELARNAIYKLLGVDQSGETETVNGSYSTKHETELNADTLSEILQNFNVSNAGGNNNKIRKGKLIIYYDENDNEGTKNPYEDILSTISSPPAVARIKNFHMKILELYIKYNVSLDIYNKIIQKAIAEGTSLNDDHIIQLLIALNKYGNSKDHTHSEILHDIDLFITRNNVELKTDQSLSLKEQLQKKHDLDAIEINEHMDDEVEDIINRALNHSNSVRQGNVNVESSEIPIHLHSSENYPDQQTIEGAIKSLLNIENNDKENIPNNTNQLIDQIILSLNKNSFIRKKIPVTKMKDSDIKITNGVDNKEYVISHKPINEEEIVSSNQVVHDMPLKKDKSIEHSNIKLNIEPNRRIKLLSPSSFEIDDITIDEQQNDDHTSGKYYIPKSIHSQKSSKIENEYKSLLGDERINGGRIKYDSILLDQLINESNGINESDLKDEKSKITEQPDEVDLYSSDLFTLKKLINTALSDIAPSIEKNWPPILSNKPIDDYIKHDKGKPFLIYVVFPNQEEQLHGDKISLLDLLFNRGSQSHRDNILINQSYELRKIKQLLSEIGINQDNYLNLNPDHRSTVNDILKLFLRSSYKDKVPPHSHVADRGSILNIMEELSDPDSTYKDKQLNIHSQENDREKMTEKELINEILKTFVHHNKDDKHSNASPENISQVDTAKLNQLKILLSPLLNKNNRGVNHDNQMLPNILKHIDSNWLKKLFDIRQENDDTNNVWHLPGRHTDNGQEEIYLSTDKLMNNVYKITIALKRRNVPEQKIREVVKRIVQKGILQITSQRVNSCTSNISQAVERGIQSALQKYAVLQ